TDSTASDEYNQDLSARRSLAVCDWLVDHGVDFNRLIAVGFGESRPMGPNDGPPGRAENRRPAVPVAGGNGRLLPGKEPTAGGYVLEVKSAEERKKEKERLAAPKTPPPPKAFTPTGDEIKQTGGGLQIKKKDDGG